MFRGMRRITNEPIIQMSIRVPNDIIENHQPFELILKFDLLFIRHRSMVRSVELFGRNIIEYIQLERTRLHFRFSEGETTQFHDTRRGNDSQTEFSIDDVSPDFGQITLMRESTALQEGRRKEFLGDIRNPFGILVTVRMFVTRFKDGDNILTIVEHAISSRTAFDYHLRKNLLRDSQFDIFG